MFSVFQFGAGRCLIFWKRAFRCNERVLLSGGGLTSVVCRFRVFNTLSRAWFHIGAVPKREKTTTSWQCTLTQQRLCFWTHENQFYHCCGTLWPLEKVTLIFNGEISMNETRKVLLRRRAVWKQKSFSVWHAFKTIPSSTLRVFLGQQLGKTVSNEEKQSRQSEVQL